MPLQRLVVSNFSTGFETDRTPFIIGNDAFPVLQNAYVWRGRVLRKRGTSKLGRLQVNLTPGTAAGTYSTIIGTNTYNILVGLGINVTDSTANIVPGNIKNITITFAAPISQSLTDTTGTGTLTVVGAGPITSAMINYATGDVIITADAVVGPADVTLTLSYYPALPVMGFEDFDIGTENEPIPIAFDTQFSYGLDQGTNQFYNTNFYKFTHDEFNFQGANYQQFWSTNYQGVVTITDTTNNTGCLWVTNDNPGFFILTITGVTIANPGLVNAVATITTSAPHNLTNADYVFLNEIGGITSTAPNGKFGGVNGASGQVTVLNPTMFTLPTPYATGMYTSGGILQYMTQSNQPGQDGIRWYDGDPTVSNNFGWVNFAPPLNPYSGTNLTPYYLAGAKLVIPFKNRLLFFGVYLVQSSSPTNFVYYSNRFVYSQVGTPYYSQPLPFPLAANAQLPDPTAWFQSVAGKGGFLTAPIDQLIISAAPVRDMLVVDFEASKMKLIYSGDDTLPFYFQNISSELGGQNTFSTVKLFEDMMSIGAYGIAKSSTEFAERVDLAIPDEVFTITSKNNNYQRVTAIRDYQKEFIYFTYNPDTEASTSIYPSQTLLFNYRDNTWATFDENYTHYGTFRRTTDRTWSSIGSIYPTWADWSDPWNFGANQAFFPLIIGGNQQGYCMIKGDGSSEGLAQWIQSITVAVGTTITSPSHNLNTGDYIYIQNMIGSTNLNKTVFPVTVISTDTFSIGTAAIGTYLGLGEYKRISVPLIQTKQFQPHWGAAQGTRIGTQRYLFDATAQGQVTVQIFSSMDSDFPDNDPGDSGYNPFTNVVFTSNANSAFPRETSQAQIWQRLNQSFNGDTVQLGITLSDKQIRDPTINEEDIVLHALVLDLFPGPTLAN